MLNLKVLLMGFQLQARLSTVQEFYITRVSNDFYLLIEPCDSFPSNLKSISEITNVCVCYNDEEDMKSYRREVVTSWMSMTVSSKSSAGCKNVCSKERKGKERNFIY